MTFGGLPAAGNALLFEDKAEVVFSGTEADYGLLLHVKAHNRLRSVDPVLVHIHLIMSSKIISAALKVIPLPLYLA